MFMSKTYAEKLKDPRWQKKRLEIMARDNFTCQDCDSTTATLHVHHRYYVSKREPWEYPPFAYKTICDECHNAVHTAEDAYPHGGVDYPAWENAANLLFPNDFAAGYMEDIGVTMLLASNEGIGCFDIWSAMMNAIESLREEAKK